MLKKRLGAEAIGKGWNSVIKLRLFYKIPTTLIIPEGVEEIGNFAFCDCWDLKKVVIPMSVKSIGCDAFVSCWRLKKVIIPESVDRIGDAAFYGCEDAEVIIEKPESEFKRIGNQAFYDCKSVEYVEKETRS